MGLIRSMQTIVSVNETAAAASSIHLHYLVWWAAGVVHLYLSQTLSLKSLVPEIEPPLLIHRPTWQC